MSIARRVGSLALVSMIASTAPVAGATNSGRQGELVVDIPRFDTSCRIDATLDEPEWARAARLTDFSQYWPADGRPAENDTAVLVWYSSTAIFFGIEARAAPGTLRATLADRDHIGGDDQVQLFLSTFNDGLQALMFAVNPLGVQADGTLIEGTTSGPDAVDLSADFVFESKGRVTPDGYVVEIRIPFKTLRYQSRDTQDWGLHVVRRVQSAGHQDSWVPARRAAASFLAQAGTLRGLTDLRRGLVLDINPFVTAKADGGESSSGTWTYDPNSPEAGANIRWGMTPNLTVNGTVNPDFSQVESDASQFVFDPRQALYFPEKRPFFLDAIEQFQTPGNLIYTRRIVAPLAAAKLTGKISGTTLAYLFAVDDRQASTTGEDHPVFNILRVQRDFGAASRAAVVYTDRIDGVNSNRVAASDARLTFHDIYAVQLQGAVSRTHRHGETITGPYWQTSVSRTGRRYGFRYSFQGVSDQFRAEAGFVSRTGIVLPRAVNDMTFYGAKGAVVERWTGGVTLDAYWQYDDFVHGRPSQDRRLHFTSTFALRGGWEAGQTLMVETFGFDENLYRNYALIDRAPDGTEVLRPFVGTPRLPNRDLQLTLETPRIKGLSGNVFLIFGKDENFYEWASANILFLELDAAWRPTERLRVDATWQVQSYERRTDHSTVGSRKLPRAKIEYQMTRAMFVRVVSQYDAEFQDDLRDDSRTELPIAYVDPATGRYERALGFARNSLRTDFLFSYQPTPGTVVFLGYGNTLEDADAHDRYGRRRTGDGFFLKVSYLFRMK